MPDRVDAQALEHGRDGGEEDDREGRVVVYVWVVGEDGVAEEFVEGFEAGGGDGVGCGWGRRRGGGVDEG